MTAIKEVLDAISKLKHIGLKLTKNDFESIIKALLEITGNNQLIKNFDLFMSSSIHDSRIEKLTERELQILNLIGEGKQNKIIATELNLRVSTIETHRKNIRKKLDLTGKGKLLETAILHKFQFYNDD